METRVRVHTQPQLFTVPEQYVPCVINFCTISQTSINSTRPTLGALLATLILTSDLNFN